MIFMIAVLAFLQIFEFGYASDEFSLTQSISIPKDFVILRDIREEDIANLEVTFPSDSFDTKSESSPENEENINTILKQNTKQDSEQILKQMYIEDPQSPSYSQTPRIKNRKSIQSRIYEIHKFEQNTFRKIPNHYAKIQHEFLEQSPKVNHTPDKILNSESFQQPNNDFKKRKLNVPNYSLKKKASLGFSNENLIRIRPTYNHLSEGVEPPSSQMMENENIFKSDSRNMSNDFLRATVSPDQLYFRSLEAKSEKSVKSAEKSVTSVSSNMLHYFEGFNNSFSIFKGNQVNNGTVGNSEYFIRDYLTNDSLRNGSNSSSFNGKTVLNSGNHKGEGIQIFFFGDFDPHTESPRQRKEVMSFDIKDKSTNRHDSLRNVGLVIMGLAGITAFALGIICVSFMLARRKRNKKNNEMFDGSPTSLVGVKETVGFIVLAIRFFLRNRKATEKERSHQAETRRKTYRRQVLMQSNNCSPNHRNKKYFSNQMAFQTENVSISPKEILRLKRQKIHINNTETSQQAVFYSTYLKEKRHVQATASKDTICTTQSLGLSFERKYVIHKSKKKDEDFNTNGPLSAQRSSSYLSFQSGEIQSSSSQISFEEESITCFSKNQSEISEELADISDVNKNGKTRLPSLPTVNGTSSSGDQRTRSSE